MEGNVNHKLGKGVIFQRDGNAIRKRVKLEEGGPSAKRVKLEHVYRQYESTQRYYAHGMMITEDDVVVKQEDDNATPDNLKHMDLHAKQDSAHSSLSYDIDLEDEGSRNNDNGSGHRKTTKPSETNDSANKLTTLPAIKRAILSTAGKDALDAFCNIDDVDRFVLFDTNSHIIIQRSSSQVVVATVRPCPVNVLTVNEILTRLEYTQPAPRCALRSDHRLDCLAPACRVTQVWIIED